ncbi:MAG: hypothetical protein M1818_000751 [Claussenomyces sp. TS43310]|nr:MAG: hypothetical protein M1818_000751 [Claussenomyces sp. TS43310]
MRSFAASKLNQIAHFPRWDPALYEKLTDNREIRLLTLHPGNPQDEFLIECSLRNVSLDSLEAHFESLSYEWGPKSAITVPLLLPSVIVNGHLFTVRRNLYWALYYLRIDTDRVMWVDALCINQDPRAKEKASQIRLMQQIYAKATQVLVWLGRHKDDSELAIKFMREAFTHPDPREWLDNTVGDQRYLAHWTALVYLLGRRYWSRIWIVQEIAVASNIKLLCGSSFFNWEQIIACNNIWYIGRRSAPWYLDRQNTSRSLGQRNLPDPNTLQSDWPASNWRQEVLSRTRMSPARSSYQYDSRAIWREARFMFTRKPLYPSLGTTTADVNRSAWSHGQAPLSYFLTYNYRAEGADGRDKVYALLGLSKQANDFGIRYDISEREVLKNLVKDLLQTTGRLDIICYAGHHQGLPSWVPYWGPEPNFILENHFPKPIDRALSWTGIWHRMPLSIPINKYFQFAPLKDRSLEFLLYEQYENQVFSAAGTTFAEANIPVINEKMGVLGSTLIAKGCRIDSIEYFLDGSCDVISADSWKCISQHATFGNATRRIHAANNARDNNLLQLVKYILHLILRAGLYPELKSEGRIEALWTLLRNDHPDMSDCPPEDWREVLRSVFDEASGILEKDETASEYRQRYLGIIGHRLMDFHFTLGSRFPGYPSRKIFVTRGGHVGFAERDAKQDDLVCVLLGCSRPMLISARTTQKRKPTECVDRLATVQGVLNGCVYLSGYMDGRAMEEMDSGKLPAVTFQLH